jgi:PAS domain S-box-containing protein
MFKNSKNFNVFLLAIISFSSIFYLILPYLIQNHVIYEIILLITSVILLFKFLRERYEQISYKSYTENLNRVIISQSQNILFHQGNVANSAKELTKQVTHSIGADRCSIWLFDSDKTKIKCQKLYIKKENKWYQDTIIEESECYSYFQALRIGNLIVAIDAETHPSTYCFSENYLKPLGIKSILDVPISFQGESIGVICIENYNKRKWKASEINFAQMLSSFYSFAHSVRESSKQKKQIEEMDDFINESTLVTKADSNGLITYVNKKFTQVSGYTLKEVLGKDHKIVSSGLHTKETWAEMYRQTIDDKKIWNKVITNRTKDGSLYYVDTFIKAEFDNETGELLGFTSIRQDVTDLKKKELDYSYRMNAINQSNMVIEFDINGFIKFANKNFCDFMGFSMEELVGKHHSMFVNFELINNSEYEKFWENLKSGQYVSSDFKRLKKNGDEVWLQATYNPILDNEGRVVRIMKIATDITEKILQSLEIDKKNTYLEHAAKILRHDMHSGINTYIPRGISSLERRLKPEDIENLKIEAPLKMIKEGLRHTQKVYSGVYEFTNLVKKDAVLNKKMCNLKQILESYLQSTAYKSQVLISNLGELEVNESLFCTAIDNLIRNGLKYNDSNTKVVTIKIEDDILIIQDNGRGLTQEEFLQLSKPYARKEGQKESGTGLGLNICVAILHEHGFEISCEKNEIGTKMKIDFK